MKIPIDIKTGSVSQLTSDNGEVVVGIDLGTTNSLIAIADQEGKPVILGGHKNRNIVPSVIHFLKMAVTLLAMKQSLIWVPNQKLPYIL